VRPPHVGGLFVMLSPSMCSRAGAPPTQPVRTYDYGIAPLSLNLVIVRADILKAGGILRARHLNQRRLAIIFRSGGVVHFEILNLVFTFGPSTAVPRGSPLV